MRAVGGERLNCALKFCTVLLSYCRLVSVVLVDGCPVVGWGWGSGGGGEWGDKKTLCDSVCCCCLFVLYFSYSITLRVVFLRGLAITIFVVFK